MRLGLAAVLDDLEEQKANMTFALDIISDDLYKDGVEKINAAFTTILNGKKQRKL